MTLNFQVKKQTVTACLLYTTVPVCTRGLIQGAAEESQHNVWDPNGNSQTHSLKQILYLFLSLKRLDERKGTSHLFDAIHRA
jgi:hypothetical protein